MTSTSDMLLDQLCKKHDALILYALADAFEEEGNSLGAVRAREAAEKGKRPEQYQDTDERGIYCSSAGRKEEWMWFNKLSTRPDERKHSLLDIRIWKSMWHDLEYDPTLWKSYESQKRAWLAYLQAAGDKTWSVTMRERRS